MNLNKLIELLPKEKEKDINKALGKYAFIAKTLDDGESYKSNTIGYNQALQDCISALPSILKKHNEMIIEEINSIQTDKNYNEPEVYAIKDFKLKVISLLSLQSNSEDTKNI